VLKDVAKKEGGGRRVAPRQAALENRLCISVTEAAQMLTISRNLAYEMVKQGRIPVIKFGKRLLIPRLALEKMLEKGAVE
jgi:excisionase family DNA binding protein